MSDELLPYYQSELAFIRKLGSEFAQKNPKIAGRLRLTGEGSEDPHVERMIEAFAYLNARTRFKIDDDFPEIAEALLGTLHPHYLAPIPSMAIAQFVLDPTQGELTAGYKIDVDSPVETEPVQGERCRFVTRYPVTLWPIEVMQASYSEPPFSAPPCSRPMDVAAVVKLQLRTNSPNLPFSALEMRDLRFFLHGQSQVVYPLYELLYNSVIEVALASKPVEARPARLRPDACRPVGFGPDESLLPYAPRVSRGYRMLAEFFTLPQKYLFWELAIPQGGLSQVGQSLWVYVYLSRTIGDLASHVTADTFRMGCTPIVNLFSQSADPIRLTHATPEYQVVPDARRPGALEIYSVEKVTAVSADQQEVEYKPFYSFKHNRDASDQRAFWHASYRVNSAAEPTERGQDAFLSVVDLDFSPAAPADWTLLVDTKCTNRELPRYLPFGGGSPQLQFLPGGPIAQLNCLTPPTHPLRLPRRQGVLWRLVSHLTLNHLSLVEGADGINALREVLTLYDYRDTAETRSIIAALSEVQSRRVVGRVTSGDMVSLARGLEVKLVFDEERLAGMGAFLMASVLERVLGLWCHINSFTRLVAVSKQREGELRRWPARAGERILL